MLRFCTVLMLTTLISQEKLSKIFWLKTRKNVAVLHFLAVDNFDFTRKIVDKYLGEKFVKMLRFCTFQPLTTLISQEKLSRSKVLSKLNFWTKVNVQIVCKFQINWALVFTVECRIITVSAVINWLKKQELSS